MVMRKLEIVFLASLALGGYRGILTPYGVFVAQTMALFFLIFVKVQNRQFVKTTSLFNLLFPLIFILYVVFRSLIDLFYQEITAQNVIDCFKPIIVVSCLSLSLVRFHLVDDLCNPYSGRRDLIYWIVVFGALSTFYILGLHVASFQIGRLADGLYFSTLYVFSTLLVFATVLARHTVFSLRAGLGATAILLSRLFVDLRRTPVVVAAGFVASYLVFQLLRLLAGYSKDKKSSLSSRVIRTFVFVIILVAVYWFIENGGFARLNLEAIQYALFDVRLVDLTIAINEVFEVKPVFGLGPIYTLNLEQNAQVHSLPGMIFLSFGVVGIGLFLTLTVRLMIVAASSFLKRGKVAETKFAFVLASVFYLAFFTFSARGVEIEAFAIFALAMLIGMEDDETRRYRSRARRC